MLESDIAGRGLVIVAVGYTPTEIAPNGDGHEALLTIASDMSPPSPAGDPEAVQLYGTSRQTNGEFTALSPTRVLDTRGGLGAPNIPVGKSATIDVQIAGRGGVPTSGASAVVMNVTAVGATAPTFITLWPTGQARPTVSNLNPRKGSVVANMAVVPLGTDGRISAFNLAGNTHLIFDVVGYYSDGSGPTGSTLRAIEPFRIFDTRSGLGGVGAGAVGPGGTLWFDLTRLGLTEFPATDVTAVVLNVTATAPTKPSFLTVWPDDVERPTASSLNFVTGQTVPNLVTVRVPSSGVIDFFNAAGEVHVVADIVGYYSPRDIDDWNGQFIPFGPQRAFDTRRSVGPIAADRWLSLDMGHLVGSVSAIAMNVTVTQPTEHGFVMVFPEDVCSLPDSSNLNFGPGETIPNMVISRLGSPSRCATFDRGVDFYNSHGNSHLVIDVVGYFL